MEDNLRSIYDKLVSSGSTGTYDEFVSFFNENDQNKRSVYDKLLTLGSKGTYDEFLTYAGAGQQPATERVDVSDVEAAQQPQAPAMESPDNGTEQAAIPTVTMEEADKIAQQPLYDIPTELTEENYLNVQQRAKDLKEKRRRIEAQLEADTEMEPLTVSQKQELERQLRGIDDEMKGLGGFIDEWSKTEGSKAYLEKQKQTVNSIDERINEKYRGGFMGFLDRLGAGMVNDPYAMYPKENGALVKDMLSENHEQYQLKAAKNEVRNAKKQLQLEDMRQNGELKGLAFIRGLETANYYELLPVEGLTDAAAMLELKKAIAEGRELTETEQLLYDAMEARAGVDFAYEDNNTMWERLGKTAPEQLMFTLQFVIGGGLTGATEAGERIAAKEAQKAAIRYAKKGVNSGARRFIGGTVIPKLEGMAVSSTIQTFANPLSLANMAEDFERRYAGDIYYDNDGNLHVFDNDRSAGQAAYQAIASAWIENFTEYSGQNITKSIRLADGKMFDLAGKFDNVMKNVGGGRIKDVFTVPQKLSHLTQIGSAPEEFLEEELGSVMNALFATDAQRGESYGDAFKRTVSQSFSGEQQLETLLSVTITSTLLGGGGNAVNAVGNAGYRREANREVERSKALLGKVHGIDIAELDNQIENGQISDISSYLKEQSDANGWSQDEQGAAVNYVLNRARQIGMKHHDDTAIEEAQAEMRKQAEDMANRWDGNIYNATWKDNEGNEQPVTIINGRIHYTTRENGTIHFNPYTSSGMIAIRLADGTKKQVPSRTITGIQSVMSVDEQLEAQGQTIPQMMQAQFEQEGMVVPTVESVFGGNLVPNVTTFEDGLYTYLGQDADGRYAFLNDHYGKDSDKAIMYLTERQLIEYGLSLNIQSANEDSRRKAQEDLDFMQQLDELAAEATDSQQWDVVKAFAARKVQFDENGGMVADGSNVGAAATYLLAVSDGSFENAIASVDEAVAAMTVGQQQQAEGRDIADDAAINAEGNANAARVDDGVAKKIDFYTQVRNALTERMEGQQEAKAEAVEATPVSQMEVGQEFPVVYDGQQAVAVVVGKDADGRNVVTIRDQDGNDLESGIDDWTDEQWERFRVRPEEATVEPQQERTEPEAEGIEQKPTEIEQNAPENEQKEPEKEQQEEDEEHRKRVERAENAILVDNSFRKHVAEDGTIIGKSGKPLTLYHGTMAKLSSPFELERGHRRPDGEKANFVADGISFTPYEDSAEEFALIGDKKGTVFAVNVTLKNPYIQFGINSAMNDEDSNAKTQRLIEQGFDGVIAYGSSKDVVEILGSIPMEVVVFDKSSIKEVTGPQDTEQIFEKVWEKYGDKAGHKIDVTAEDKSKTLDKAKKALEKAQTDYDDAPIGKEEKAEAALQKAQEEYNTALAEKQEWDEVKAVKDRFVAELLAAQQAADEERHARAVAEEEARRAEEERKAREREATGANNVAPNIREKWEGASKVEGNADEITLANGERIAGHYVLVESGAASASHDALNGFAKTEGFPLDENEQSVNDRDYERDQNAQQITRQIAAEYDSRALQQPVVVSQDGVVLSGNGRTMAGEIAAAQNTDGAYIDYLKKYAPKYGFTPEQVEGMAHPRVVFVPDASMPYTAETFAKFNQQEMKGQSKTEQAVKLGKLVDDATFGRIIRSINRFDTLGDFYADTNATAEAIGELLKAGAINQMQHTEMFDGDAISAQGREILENMLIGKAFESNPDAVRQLAAYKSLRQSVITALAEISNNIALGEYSLESELSDAIALAYNARKNGYKAGDAVSEFARQGKLFETEEDATAADYTNATVLMLADVMNDNRVTRLKKVLSIYNQQAEQSAAGQTDLFAEGVKTKQEILDEVLVLLQHGTETEQQQALDAAREQRKAAAEQGTGVQENGDTGEGDNGDGGRVVPENANHHKAKSVFSQGTEGDKRLAISLGNKGIVLEYDDNGVIFGSSAGIYDGFTLEQVFGKEVADEIIATISDKKRFEKDNVTILGAPVGKNGFEIESKEETTEPETPTEEPPMESAGEGTELTPPGPLSEGELGPTDEAVAAANEEVDTNPTEAQKEAGNYKKGHVTIDGFDISIENPAGSTRRGTDAQGNPWSVTMHNSYGYIRMTEGVDGDHIDIFLSDHIDDWNGTVYVVDQVNADGSFDEHKVMYGFNSAEEAREAYLSNYSEGWQGLGTITGVSREEFKKWVDSSHRKTKAFADYKSVQATEGQNEAAMESQQTEEEKQSSPWYGSIDDAPTPEGLKRGQKARLFEEGERAYRNASLKVPTFQLGVEKKVELTYEMFEKEYSDIVGNFFFKEDKPYLKEFYDYFNARMDAAEIKSQTEGTEQEAANTQPTGQDNNTTDNQTEETPVEENSGNQEKTSQDETPAEQPIDDSDIDALIEDYKKKAAATNKIWSAWLADPSGKPADYGTTRDEEAKAYGRVREALAGVSEEKLAEMENTNYGDSLLNDLIKEERNRRNEQKEIEQRFTDGLEKQGEIGKQTKPVSIEKILPEFTSRDEQRPIMNCIYYDPEGYAVASDAFILIASKSQYDPKQEGKMVAAHKIKGVAEKGDEVEGKFMKWRNVISQAKANSAEIDLPKLRDFLAGVKELMKGSKDDAIVQVRMPNGEIIGFEPEYLLKFVQGAEAMGVKEIEYIAPNRAITGVARTALCC